MECMPLAGERFMFFQLLPTALYIRLSFTTCSRGWIVVDQSRWLHNILLGSVFDHGDDDAVCWLQVAACFLACSSVSAVQTAGSAVRDSSPIAAVGRSA
jgi:hypothetical protein